MKWTLGMLGALLLAAALSGPVFARSDEVTVTGTISDSMCGLSHADMQAKHGGAALFSERECTEECVKGGAKYVLADKEGLKTYNLKDQKKVARYAGKRVQISGDLKEGVLDPEKISEMP